MYGTTNGIMFMNEEQAREYCEAKGNGITYSHYPTTMIFNILTGEWE